MTNALFMRIAAFLPAILLITSCAGENSGSPPSDKPVGRVVIAYLCGDNDLSSDVGLKIEALGKGMAAAGEIDGRLVVYADSRDNPPRLMEVTATGTVIIETAADMDSASPDNMKRILQGIVADFPARGYGLICFSHASGWLPQGALEDPAGFSPRPAVAGDTRTIFEDRGSEMTVAELARALDVLPGPGKFDFILFETCYMAGIEVVYELRERTRYIIASSAEILSDGFTGIYPECIGLLFDPEPQLETFARTYFDLWNAKQGAWRSATVSLINTAHIDELALQMSLIMESDPGWVSGIDILALQHFNRNSHRLFFDLEQVVDMAAAPEQAAVFGELLAKTVEYKAATPYFMYGNDYAFAISRHSGMTAYIPQEAYPLLNSAHALTGWYERVTAE